MRQSKNSSFLLIFKNTARLLFWEFLYFFITIVFRNRACKYVQCFYNTNILRLIIYVSELEPDMIMSLDDLKLTIRCLSLTTLYFVSQLCTFVPGIMFVNTDQELNEEHRGLLDIRIRLVIWAFYLLQFVKPIFFFIFDFELRMIVLRLFCCLKK